MRNENRTKPEMEMNTAKQISQTYVLVFRFWPSELQNEIDGNFILLSGLTKRIINLNNIINFFDE